jgi:hypothetical protein
MGFHLSEWDGWISLGWLQAVEWQQAYSAFFGIAQRRILKHFFCLLAQTVLGLLIHPLRGSKRSLVGHTVPRI